MSLICPECNDPQAPRRVRNVRYNQARTETRRYCTCLGCGEQYLSIETAPRSDDSAIARRFRGSANPKRVNGRIIGSAHVTNGVAA
jgi:RNase P subunit RPR2